MGGVLIRAWYYFVYRDSNVAKLIRAMFACSTSGLSQSIYETERFAQITTYDPADESHTVLLTIWLGTDGRVPIWARTFVLSVNE